MEAKDQEEMKVIVNYLLSLRTGEILSETDKKTQSWVFMWVFKSSKQISLSRISEACNWMFSFFK